MYALLVTADVEPGHEEEGLEYLRAMLPDLQQISGLLSGHWLATTRAAFWGRSTKARLATAQRRLGPRLNPAELAAGEVGGEAPGLHPRDRRQR